MHPFSNASHARGTTLLNETPQDQRVCKHEVNRNKVCKNLAWRLNLPDVDMAMVMRATGCSSDEFDRAKQAIIIPLHLQKRILLHFHISLETAAFEDLTEKHILQS